MNGIPLLSESWRDIISLGSLVVTVVGFVLAFWQIRKTKSAADAARDAAIRAYDENRGLYRRFVLSCATRFLVEARFYADSEHWDRASLRLRDVGDQVSQLLDADPDWQDLLAELRRLDAALGANPKPKFTGKRWVTLIERLQAKIDSHHGPFKDLNG
jgi:hypothetical protein